MNCTNCNSPLKEGAKFCTSCGTKVMGQIPISHCENCNSPLKEGVKFCTNCGTKVSESTGIEKPQEVIKIQNDIKSGSIKEVDNFSVVKHKLVWNIQKGEVARVISEEEFSNYSQVVGLIVNEGTKALIRLNGEVVAEISSGVYDFVDQSELDKELKKTDVMTPIKRGFGIMVNLFKKAKPKVESVPGLDSFISKLQKGNVFSVVLVLDVPITLLFGKEHSDNNEFTEFVPLKVQAKNLDLELGIRAQFKITKVIEFAKQYLLSNNSVTTNMIVAQSAPIIGAAVRRIIAQYDIEESIVPQNCIDRIDEHLKSQNSEILAGLSLLKIVEVTVVSDDLERFRALNQELYLTQREMEYLQRTNDFKNRLTDIENQQIIYQSRSDLDLNKSLQEINKDKILSEDELDKFYMLLSRERKIRDAKNEDEIEAALHDIEKTGLMRDEDLERLKYQIATDSHKRGFTLEMMRLKDSITYETTLKNAEIEFQTNYVRAEVEQARLRDDYDDERYRKQVALEVEAQRAALDIKRQQQQQDEDIEDRRSKRQMDDFMRMAELKQSMQNQTNEHEINIMKAEQEAKLKMREASQNFTAEQMMAMAANENLDAEAAREFARSFSAGKEAEVLKESAEKMDKLSQARVDDMKEMMRAMMDHNQAVTSSLAYSKEESKNEYKERLNIEQQRLDRTQDSALNYTTRNNIGMQQSAGGRVCGNCNNTNPKEARFCEHCGNEI